MLTSIPRQNYQSKLHVIWPLVWNLFYLEWGFRRAYPYIILLGNRHSSSLISPSNPPSPPPPPNAPALSTYWPTHHIVFSSIHNDPKDETFHPLFSNILQLPFCWAKIGLKAFWGNLGSYSDAVFTKKTENTARKSARVLIMTGWAPVMRSKRSAEKKLEHGPWSHSALSYYSAAIR